MQSPDQLPDGSRAVVLIDQILQVNGMQDQLGTVNRSQARRKRWFAHYPQSIAISVLVTVTVLVPRPISSQLPDGSFVDGSFVEVSWKFRGKFREVSWT